jgi:hypothetical protein
MTKQWISSVILLTIRLWELQPALAAIQVNATLQKKARKAFKQIVKESELQELWTESGDLEEWLAIQTDLLERLK